MYIKKDIVIFTQKHLPHENKTTFVFFIEIHMNILYDPCA